MQVQVFLIVILIFALIMLLPIFVQIRLYINALNNIGVIAISVFGIKIICLQLEISGGKINIIGKKKDRQIDPNSVDVKFVNKFVYYLVLKIKITNLAIFFDVSKQSDAFLPCVLRGLTQSLIGMVLGILYTKKGVFNTSVGGDVKWDRDKVVLSMYVGMVFNLAMIITALIQAKIKTKRRAEVYAKRKAVLQSKGNVGDLCTTGT